VVDLTDLSIPRVLERRQRMAAMVAMMGVLEVVARKILQQLECEGLHARPRQAKYVRPESRPPVLMPNNLRNAMAPSGKEASPMASP